MRWHRMHTEGNKQRMRYAVQWSTDVEVVG